MIMLRPAQASDSEDLFNWRNDPVTQACSRSTEPIARDDHARWMEFNVMHGYPQHLVMMAESDFGTVGVVRFDGVKGDVLTYDVSITIAPKHRGKGFGANVLSDACNYMGDYTLDAEVRRENTTSRRLFEQCGFEEIERGDGFLKFRREPLR